MGPPSLAFVLALAVLIDGLHACYPQFIYEVLQGFGGIGLQLWLTCPVLMS